MGRPSKPHYHAASDGYRFTIDGVQYWRKKQSASWALFHKLQHEAGGDRSERDPLTLAGAVDRWVIDAGAGDFAEEMLGEFIEWLGDRSIDDVPANLLQKYARHLRTRKLLNPTGGETEKRGVSVSTLRKKMYYANAVMKHAHKRGWIRILPDLPKMDRPVGKPKARPIEDVADLLETIDASNRLTRAALIIRFMLETAARPSEARKLRWSDVDIPHRVAVLGEHKTGSRTGKARIIPLSDAAIGILESIKDRKTHVFISRLGKPYTEDGLSGIMGRLGFSPYIARHQMCQRMADLGTPDSVMAEVLGHGSEAMIRMYRRISKTTIHDAVALASGLSQIPPRSEQEKKSAPVAGAKKDPSNRSRRRA